MEEQNRLPEKTLPENSQELIQTRSKILSTVRENKELYSQLPRAQQLILSARYENLPISEYNFEYFKSKEFRARMVLWCGLAGIRETPDQANLAFLIEYITNDICGLTLEEIERCIKMNILGQFDQVYEPYNMLNVKFISQMVNAYKKHRKQADEELKRLNKEVHKPKLLDIPEFMMDYKHAECVFDMFVTYFQDRTCLVYITGYTYDFLVRTGLISVPEEYKQISDDRAQMQVRKQSADLTASDSHRKWLRDIIKEHDRFTREIDRVSKENIIKYWFDKIIENSGDIRYMLLLKLHELHPSHFAHPSPASIDGLSIHPVRG